jgi:hypothetical protein
VKNRLKSRVNQKQKTGTRMLIIVGTCGTMVFLILLMFVYYGDIRRVKARQAEFLPVEEQQFSSEMALPAPFVRSNNSESRDAILSHKLKSPRATPVTNN